jgi:hypothetical protein
VETSRARGCDVRRDRGQISVHVSLHQWVLRGRAVSAAERARGVVLRGTTRTATPEQLMRNEAESGEYAHREQIAFDILRVHSERACWNPPAGGGVRRLRETRSPQLHPRA